jgi:hypothetical protein
MSANQCNDRDRFVARTNSSNFCRVSCPILDWKPLGRGSLMTLKHDCDNVALDRGVRDFQAHFDQKSMSTIDHRSPTPVISRCRRWSFCESGGEEEKKEKGELKTLGGDRETAALPTANRLR